MVYDRRAGKRSRSIAKESIDAMGRLLRSGIDRRGAVNPHASIELGSYDERALG